MLSFDIMGLLDLVIMTCKDRTTTKVIVFNIAIIDTAHLFLIILRGKSSFYHCEVLISSRGIPFYPALADQNRTPDPYVV